MQYMFEGLQFDPAGRQLTSQAGTVDLEPLTADLLRYLLIHRDRIVSKDELVSEVWHGRAVSDATVTSRLSVARSALAAAGAGKSCIRTFARSGFRFVAAVEVASGVVVSPVVPAGPPPSPAPPRPGGPVVALRPFAASPSDPVVTDFALGLHEDLLTAFCTAGWPTRTTVTAAGRGEAPRADHVVEGRVRRAGSGLVVTARLVETATGMVVRCLRLEVEDTGCRAEGTMAASIHGSFAAHLEQSGAAADPGDDPRPLYAAGRRSLFGWTRPDLETALSLFKSAIEVDSGFAPAYAMAAYCHVQRISFGCADDRQHAAGETERLARTAAQLMPGDPAVLATAAHALAAVVGDLDTAITLAERAIRCGPLASLPRYVDGWLSLFAGRPEAALAQLELAGRLAGTHPMAFKIDGAMSYACLLLGRWDEGARHAERALAQHPTYLTGRRGAAANLVLVGAKDRASRHLREMRLVDPDLRARDLGRLLPFRQPRHLETWAQAMKRAGLPE